VSASGAAPEPVLKVAIAGLGAVGSILTKRLDADAIEGVRLTAVCGRDLDKTSAQVLGLRYPVKVVPLSELAVHADVIIECAPASALSEILTPFLALGKPALVLSVGGLLQRPELTDLAKRHGAHILVPSGALLGLDAVLAAAEGTIHSVRLITRKPPAGLLGAPHLVANAINVVGLLSPLCVFKGNALEAVRAFPANVNVVAALALAGIGATRTEVEIWADPGLTRNIHAIQVDSDAATFSMQIENIPSENPKTSRIVVQSVLAVLRKRVASLRIGS
jgi:aspartate dehydrogenase